MSERMAAESVWTGRAILGEGPLWSASRAEVLFTDIKGGRLIAWHPAREWPVPDNLCWLVERTMRTGSSRACATGSCICASSMDE
jgi:D-xylonolactonase